MSVFNRRAKISGRALLWSILVTSIATAPLAAVGAPLVPMTRLKLSVVQFVASSGEYRRWDALGGEFDVAADGTINVPTLGAISVGKLTADQLAGDIAHRLQQKLGLLDPPDASVQVIQYPPIYVVGSVSAPGEFAYHPGITVLQALALAGGERRVADGPGGAVEAIRLEADLAGSSRDILRLTARLARLNAEFDQSAEIAFPSTLDASEPTTATILDQERRIFAAHVNEQARQKTGLVDLAALYNAEIDALGQKMAAVDGQITRAEQQAASIKGLVDSGSATTSRLNDAERVLADLRSGRLDNVIATMTARENLNRAQRDLAKIEDEQQSETANLLQEDQANLERLLQQRSATQRILIETEQLDQGSPMPEQVQASVNYLILRQQDGAMSSLPATDVSPLQPGDLVKVTMVQTAPDNQADTALADSQ